MSDDIQNLRGMMHGAAERRPLPERFSVVSGQGPEAIITDYETGRTSTVPLHALGPVRNLLQDLFGDPEVTEARDYADRLGAFVSRVRSMIENAENAHAETTLRVALDLVQREDLADAAAFIETHLEHFTGPSVVCCDCGKRKGSFHNVSCQYRTKDMPRVLEVDCFDNPGDREYAEKLIVDLRAEAAAAV
jgi:hypothetical protein